MTPQPDRLQEIFAQAKEKKSPTEREQFLAEACRGEPELRREVESLLGANEQAGDFLRPTIKLEEANFVSEKTGTLIGRYKVMEKIGEGGFGAVYMAEQQQPVQRKVALKIIKPGMDTREIVARFEAERQALALMDHPNIARVLDAGATEQGRPYFVMELVRGIPITDFCDQKNLSTHERLQLFIKVCHAVQHAHQKAIIHRDLKPSNVLVTLHDGEPVPKVIDFGIAKALGHKLTEKTLFTGFAHLIGTPAYMSPEQAEMSGLDIDTRADIYSLGVLLYELLTGETPFDKDTLRRAALDEIRRMIRETEPPKPSTRLRTLGEKITDVAKRRHTEPAGLSRLVRGDLDWITMRCLEKDRGRRYETANGLASDIQRHLNHEPVVARPASNLYRLQTFVHRNKLAVAAASMVGAALVIGLGVSTWSLVREKEARQIAEAARKEQERLRQAADADRQKAETEASKSRQVAQFLGDMLQSVGPSVALGRDTKMLREVLDKTVERVGKDLMNQPEVEAEIRNIIGTVYQELGEFLKAETEYRRALALRQALLGTEHPDTATSLQNLAGVLWRQGKLVEAETVAREALAMRRRLLSDENLRVAESLDTLATVRWRQGKLAEAESIERETLAMRRRLLGTEHLDVAESLDNVSAMLWSEGKLAEAEILAREALMVRRKLLGEEHPEVAISLNNLANVLRDQAKLAEAERTHHQALAMRRKLLGNEHPHVATSLNNLATVVWRQGRLSEAETMLRQALATRIKTLGGEHPDVATSLASLGGVCRAQGRLAEAEALFQQCLGIREKNSLNEWQTFSARGMLGGSLLDQKKYAGAEPLLLSAYEGLSQREAEIPADARGAIKEAVQQLAQLYNATGQSEKAAEWNKQLAELDKADAEMQPSGTPRETKPTRP